MCIFTYIYIYICKFCTFVFHGAGRSLELTIYCRNLACGAAVLRSKLMKVFFTRTCSGVKLKD